MSTRVNLNDNISDAFQFTIGGLDYDFKYPTMEDFEPMGNLYKERDAAEKKHDDKKVAEIDEKLQKALYDLIIPVGHDTPIQDTLKKQPYPVVKAFNKMVKDQLSAE